MCEWFVSSAATHQEIESNSVRGRRRGDRTNPATASNLVALPILLLFLGLPSHHREAYLWLCAAGTVTEFLHQNTSRGATEMDNYVLPSNVTTFSGQRIVPPNVTKRGLSRVPPRGSKENSVGMDYNMQNVLRDNSARNNYAHDFKRLRFWRKTGRKKSERHRRAVENLGLQSSSVSNRIVQPTPSPRELGEIIPTWSQFTVPDVRSTATSGIFNSDLQTTYATTDYPQPTPSLALRFPVTTAPAPGGFSSRPYIHPSPSLQNPDPPRNTPTIQPSPTPTTFLSTLPSPNAVSTTHLTASTPQELTDEPASPARYDSQSPEPTKFMSTVGDGTASSHQAETDAVGSTAIPWGLETETRYKRQPSSMSFTEVFSHASTLISSSWNETTPSSPPMGPQNVNAGGQNAKQSLKVYTIVTDIKTAPSILIIMPCLVGLALLGLVGAGVKRCVLHWRLSHVVEVVRDPERLNKDKGYTIENRMVKSRRSYNERQMDKTLQKVNKTESNSSECSSNSNSSRNTTNNKRDTKVRMEIATISDGSLRRPVRPLRRSASERIAPSRRKSSAGYFTPSHSECTCYCHCPMCGREGLPLTNGGVTTGITTTRL